MPEAIQSATDRRFSAVQYLRVSTDLQKYSTQNQADAIAAYAATHGLIVIRTYEDSGRSGLSFEGREALKRLIVDVHSENPDFSTILVYDVSRWGRFQDADESAYYEFLCKEAGVSVHYCAEPFQNDGSISATIIKNLKRAMAGEYSRDLSTKVAAGKAQLAKLGFRQGGDAGYGLRRQLIDQNGHPKALLARGERKMLQSDRVILVPGPESEIEVVRSIYRQFVKGLHSETQIARQLNERGLRTVYGRLWTPQIVREILTNEKYIGTNVFSKSIARLNQRLRRNEPDNWIRVEGAFTGIVDPELFSATQKIIQQRTRRLSNDQTLDQLRSLLKHKRRLGENLINHSNDVPAANTFRRRFGGLAEAYTAIGYTPGRDLSWISVRRRRRTLMTELRTSLLDLLMPLNATIDFRSDGVICINNQLTAVVYVVAPQKRKKVKIARWRMEPRRFPEVDFLIVGRMNENGELVDYFLLPHAEAGGRTMYFTPPLSTRLQYFRFPSLDAVCSFFARIPVSDVENSPLIEATAS